MTADRRPVRWGNIHIQRRRSDNGKTNIEHPTLNAQHRTSEEKYNLEERLLEYAAAIIRLVEHLPDTRAGNHVAGRMLDAHFSRNSFNFLLTSDVLMFDVALMRTTLDLDDDVLAAARSLAKVRKRAVGKIVSELAREALRPGESNRVRNGVPLFARKPGQFCVSLKLVNQLRDDTP